MKKKYIYIDRKLMKNIITKVAVICGHMLDSLDPTRSFHKTPLRACLGIIYGKKTYILHINYYYHYDTVCET